MSQIVNMYNISSTSNWWTWRHHRHSFSLHDECYIQIPLFTPVRLFAIQCSLNRPKNYTHIVCAFAYTRYSNEHSSNHYDTQSSPHWIYEYMHAFSQKHPCAHLHMDKIALNIVFRWLLRMLGAYEIVVSTKKISMWCLTFIDTNTTLPRWKRSKPTTKPNKNDGKLNNKFILQFFLGGLQLMLLLLLNATATVLYTDSLYTQYAWTYSHWTRNSRQPAKLCETQRLFHSQNTRTHSDIGRILSVSILPGKCLLLFSILSCAMGAWCVLGPIHMKI